MEYGLARLLLGDPSFLKLPKRRFEQLVHARQNLSIAVEIENTLDIFVENLFDFELGLLDKSLRSTTTYFVHDGEAWRLDSNRRLANLLASARSYRDQVQSSLSRIYRRRGDKAKFEKLRGLFEIEQDKSLGYRAIEKIRDITQHRGYPVHMLSLFRGREDDEPGPSRIRYSAEPPVDIDQLRQAQRSGKQSDRLKKIISELEPLTVRSGGKASYVPLMPLVREHLTSIGRIHVEIRRELEPDVAGWDQAFTEAIDDAEREFDGDVIGLAAVAKDETGVYAESHTLWRGLIDRRNELERKNASLNFESRYASNQ